MNFNSHSALQGRHSFLSPSNYHWINYDDQRLAARFETYKAAARGTRLHDLAHSAIDLGVKLSTSNKTLSMYVADGIGYKMKTEQALYYSQNCFGHADTLSFRRHFLRVHDLKTGMAKTSPVQLEVYCALFCLEYHFSPFEIEMETRIYQNDAVQKFIPEPDKIAHIMDRIVTFDKMIDVWREEME